jgi:hypothetical protein
VVVTATDAADSAAAEGESTDSADVQPDPCAGTAAAVAKVRFYFVLHVEEDDANCVANSANIPDFNGDEATFNHFADAWYDYAKMLRDAGAAFSFQTDWTFVEGVQKFRPAYFADLLALGDVEVVPHAHETCVTYDALYTQLEAAGAHPVKIIGGMTFDDYVARRAWFDANPGWTFWNGPFGTPNHTNDASTPPFVYRVRPPAEVSEVADLYVHAAASPLIVTPGLGWEPDALLARRPSGRFLVTGWQFLADRWFLADPTDTRVPLMWRKKPAQATGTTPSGSANMSATELTAWIQDLIRTGYQPLVDSGDLEFAQLSHILAAFRAHEACLDLSDGQDLTPFVPTPPN